MFPFLVARMNQSLRALLCWLLLFAGGPVFATCSSYLGKVVFNELQDPNSGTTYLELRILDPNVIANTSNFTNWRVDVYRNNVSTKTFANLNSVFTNAALNNCGTNSAWVRIPDSSIANYISGSNGINNLNFVLYENTSGGQIVDIFRWGAASSFYGAGSNYTSCPAIESALPSSRYDSAWISNGYKDWFRTPDGTGTWGNGQTANNVNSICSSNDGNTAAQIGLNKVASATTVPVNTNFTFTLFAQNGATGTAQTNVVVTDNLTTAGLTFVSCTPTTPDTCTYSAATGLLTWTVGTTTNPFALNTTKSATLTVRASTVGTKTNTIVSNTSGNPSATSTVTIIGPDHVRLNHTGAGVTCTGSSVTVNACASADTSGSCTAYTNGVSGNVVAKNGATVVATVPFTIAAGSSSTTVTMPATSAQTVTFETSGLSVATVASPAWTCWNGSTASCSHAYADAGFVFDVPNHVSEVLQTVSLSAVKRSDNSLACTPAFASLSKSVTFACSYTNPVSGTLPVRVNGGALNASASAASACDAGGRAVSLAFDATGVASTTFQYADVGNMMLTATYIGSGAEAGLTMTGTDTFIAAPKDFAFSAITAAPIKAGNSFSATITARNNANAATPNFGKEASPAATTLTSTLVAPNPVTFPAASNPTLGNNTIPGSEFGAGGMVNDANGVATVNNLSWGEVGSITLTAASADYLSSGLTATGTSVTVGAFIPDHFDTAVIAFAGVPMPCPSGLTCPVLYNGFVYSSQPFSVQATARNLANGTTTNYHDTYGLSNPVNLEAWDALGSVLLQNPPGTATGSGPTNASIAKTAFVSGVGSTSALTYKLLPITTAPTDIYLRAVDSVNATVTSRRAIAANSVEGGVKVVNGRIKIPNMYGSERLTLPFLTTVQYYNGTYWATSTTDNVTSFNTNLSTVGGNLVATVKAGPITGVTVVSPGAVAVVGGEWKFILAAPLVSGSVGLLLNAPTYLPSNEGRATFGIFKSPLIYRRENY
ncbi:MAG: DUF6701 domain-containing protein [Pseudomonadota bacterium]